MILKTEKKVTAIYHTWMNGDKRAAAKQVRDLTKLELFSLISTHQLLAIPEFIGRKERQLSFENFVGNALEGAYS